MAPSITKIASSRVSNPLTTSAELRKQISGKHSEHARKVGAHLGAAQTRPNSLHHAKTIKSPKNGQRPSLTTRGADMASTPKTINRMPATRFSKFEKQSH